MIMQVRLKGLPEGHFHNIEFHHGSLAALTHDLNEGQVVTGDRLWTTANGPGKRTITNRSEVALKADGVDWMMSPTVTFSDAEN